MTRRWDVVAFVSVGLAFLATLLLYKALPDPVPVHFDLEGNPNGWMARRFVTLVPLLGLVSWAIVRFTHRIFPSGDRWRLSPGIASFVAMMTAVFVSAIHLVILYVAIVPGSSVTRPTFLLVGGLYVGLGLIMPRVRRNPIIGIRTAWTLTSDENWARTHRVAGYTMVDAGVVGGLAGMFGGSFGGAVALASFLLGALVPVGYSIAIAREKTG